LLPRITTKSPVPDIYRQPARLTFGVAAATLAVSAALTAALAGARPAHTAGGPTASLARMTVTAPAHARSHAAHQAPARKAAHRAAWHPVLGLDSMQGVRPSAIPHTGVHFEARYIAPGNPKTLTRTELAGLQHYGTRVVATWEQGAMDMLGGYRAGHSAARRAQRGLNSLGIPHAAVYFCADFDVTTAQQGAINSYLRGAASVIGLHRTGLYGGYWAIKGAFDAHVIHYGWQTYAWSGGRWDPRAALHQYSVNQYRAGTTVDLNLAVHRNYGAVYPVARHGQPHHGQPHRTHPGQPHPPAQSRLVQATVGLHSPARVR
jgi:hypothetical protein